MQPIHTKRCISPSKAAYILRVRVASAKTDGDSELGNKDLVIRSKIYTIPKKLVPHAEKEGV